MTLDQLETRFARDQHSPLFARLAGEYLRARRFDEALKLCLDGIQRFPEYATAHFIAAQCFAQKGEFEPALRHIEHALDALPDNTILLALRKSWLDKSKTPREYVDRLSPMNVSLPEKVTEKIKTDEQTAPKSEITSQPSTSEPTKEVLGDSPITSVTLAEIYAMQGAYEAAIAMYRKLQKQKPHQADQFEMKIRELKEKLEKK